MKNATTLNDLIEINNDRIAGYEKASTETKDNDLQNVFREMASQSRQLKTELSDHVRVEGKEPAEGTTTRGKIYRAWMDVKVAFKGKDRKTVLNSCEFGEDAAQRAYTAAMKEDELSPETRKLIQHQKDELKISHDRIKRLRDSEPTS